MFFLLFVCFDPDMNRCDTLSHDVSRGLGCRGVGVRGGGGGERGGKWNKPERQTLGRWNLWKQAKLVKLYSDSL